VLKDCSADGLDLCGVEEHLLFEEMTSVANSMPGLTESEEDNLRTILTEKDFLNMEAVENDVNGKYTIVCIFILCLQV
jgi:hypothetical protein